MQRLVAGLFGAVLCAGLLSTQVGCQDFLPANPYDPQAPAHVQARGEIRGQIVISGTATHQVLQALLDEIRVQLTGGSGQELARLGCASAPGGGASITCSVEDRGARFAFAQLPPGEYRVAIEGMDPAYAAPGVPPISLLPGEIEDLGVLRFTEIVVDPTQPTVAWTGRVTGVANLSAGQGGPRRMTLLRRGGSGLEAHAVALTDSQGSFSFDQVPPGVYGLSAELEQHTPDYRAGLTVQGAEVPVEQNTQAFTGSDGLLLHPVTAVLIPALQQTFGQYYTSADRVPVQVLQFGGMNQMRLSTDAGFASGTQTWVEYAASADVDLPAVEGAVDVHAQFRNTRVEGFAFESSVYSAQVVRDVSPPTVEGLRVRGRTAGEDGRIWLAAEGETLGLEIDGADAVSAVYQVAVHHDAQNGAGDPATLVYDLVNSPGGLVRLTRELTLTAGEGEKTAHVYLRDRAGNQSAAGSVEVWVDATAPVVDLLVLNTGATVTGQRTVTLALRATDQNRVAGMRFWEEGQPEPAGYSAYQEVTTLQLRPLDYANTQRQVNARVIDQAGNPSTTSSATITFDDRGSVSGLLAVEDAADGSAGDIAGISALVNGQSYPLTATAGLNPGDPWRFAVTGIPSGQNLLLQLRKDGYADASPSSLFSVAPGAATDVGQLTLALARGAIEGWAQIEGSVDHSNVVARVDSSGQFALSDAQGYFRIEQVPARLGYSVTLSYDSVHATQVVSGVDVPANGATRLSQPDQPIVLALLAGSFVIAQGSYSNERTVTLILAYDDATQYRASTNRGDLQHDLIAWSAFSNAEGSTTGYPFELPDQDGLHSVYVQFRNPDPTSGFVTEIFSDAVTLDRVAPSSVGLRLNSGATHTRTLAVTLEPSGSDDNPIPQLQLAHRDTTVASELVDSDWAAPRPWNGQPFGVTLPGLLAFRTARVWVRLIDAAGNPSAPALASIVVDPAAPVGGSILIEGGAAVTRNFLVTLSLTASDDTALEMLIADEAVPATGTWRAYAPSTAWVLPPATQGTKRVCVAFRDAADNRTQDFCDDIVFDSVAPPTPAMTTTAGSYTSQLAITLDFGNVTADVAQIEVAGNAAFSGSFLHPAQAQVPFVLSSGDGAKLVYARYIDVAGNTSAAAALGITLDTEAPLAPSLSVAQGLLTRSRVIDLNLSALGASEVLISRSGSCTTGGAGPDAGGLDTGGSVEEGWRAFATQVPWLLLDQDGPQDVSVRYRDLAGNATGCLSARVTLDRVPPTTGTPAIALSNLRLELDATGTTVQRVLARVDLSATGASAMRLSNYQNDSAAPWLAYAASFADWELIPTDGQRDVYVVFRDAAGNPTGELSAGIFVDTTGEIVGSLAVEGASDFSGVEYFLDGNPMTPEYAGSAFAIADVLATEYGSLLITKAGYDSVTVRNVRVPPGGSADLGALSLKRSRGAVEGYVKLADATSHENVLVELVNTGYTARSNSAGYFFLGDVLVGTYDLKASRDGYSAQLRTGIAVSSGLTVAVSTLDVPIDLPLSSGDYSINGGTAYTSSTTVHLNLSFTDAVSFVASESETFDGASPVPYTGAGAYAFDLGPAPTPPQGTHTVFVQFETPTGPSEVLQSSIVLDTIPPAQGSVLLAGGASAIKVLNVSAALASSDQNGIARIATSTDGASFAPPVTYQTPYTYGFTGDEGAKCLFVQFIDPAGNRSTLPAASDCITYDITGPTGSVAIVDAGGAPYPGDVTRSRGVYLRLTSSDLDGQMKISNKSTLADAVWQPYDSALQPWNLNAGDGDRTVFIALRDLAGTEVKGVAGFDATIRVDSTPPAAPAFTIAEGVATSSTTLHLSFTNWTAGETVLFESNQALGVVQTANAAGALSFALPAVDGLHLLSLRYRDAAGNESATAGASITLDRAAPRLLRFAVEGSGYTRSGTVTLVVEADGATQMRLSNGADYAGASWEPYSTRRLAWPLDTASQGTKSIRVQLRDAALNATAGDDLARVEYDTVVPAATLVLAGGADPVATRTIAVELQGASADSAWMAVSSAGAPSCEQAAYSAFAAEFSHTLATANGPNTVYVCLKDLAGNWDRLSEVIVHDATAPLIGSVSVPTTSTDEGGLVAVQVTLANDEDDVVTVTLSSAHATTGSFQIDPSSSRTGSSAIDLLPAGGGHGDADVLLEIQATDPAGNSYTTTRVVRVDRSGPTGSVLIDGGATFSTSASGQVTLTLSATDNFAGVARMRFSHDGSTWDSWQPYSSSFGPWILQSPTSQNNVEKNVHVQFEDALGNLNESTVSDSIFLDNVAPVAGVLQIEGGAGTTSSRVVDLTFGATAATEMKVSPGSACVGGGWEPYVEATPTDPYRWVLDGEGDAVYASVRFRDAAGNESGCISDSIAVDLTSPELPAIVIDGGATYNNSQAHQLSVLLGATDATAYRLAESAAGLESASWDSPVPATAFTYTLAASNQGDGEKTLFAQFRDAAGNLSVVVSDGIVHDATPPVVGYLLVDNGAEFSRSGTGQVSLYFGGSDEQSGLSGVQVSNDDITWSTAQTYTGYIASWTLAAPVALVDGEERTVRLRLIDRAGNVSTLQLDGSDQDNIWLDNVAPSGTLAINGTALYASSQAVVVAITTDDDVELVALANDTAPSCASAAYSGRQDQYAWTLSAGDTPAPGDPKTVYACFRDRAGNSSSAASDTIRLDTQAPSFFTVTEYPAGTPSAITSDLDGGVELVVTLDAPDQDNVSLLASVVGSTASASGALAQGITVTTLHLDAAPALNAAADGSYVIDVTATDAAGNSYAETRVVLVDRQAPTLSALTCPGCRACEGRQFVQGVAVQLVPQGFDDTSGIERFALRDATDALVDTAGLGEPLDFNLQATEGVVQTYTARAIDRAGIESDAVEIELVHDALAPTLAVEINNGDLFTATSSVEIGLTLADGNLAAFPECYELRHAWGAPPTGTWGPYVGTFPSTVNSPTSDESKTLYVQVRDPAGRTVGDDDAITLDTTAPTVGIDVQSTDGDDDYTINSIVDVTLTFSNDTRGYRLVPAFDDCATLSVDMFMDLTPNSTSLALDSFDLAAVPGLLPPFDTPEGDPVTLKACFRDGADNRAGDSDTITLDRVPLIGAVVIDGDAAYTTDLDVTLTFAVDASDTDLVYVCNGLDETRCEDNLGPCDASRSFVDSYSSTRSWTLAAGDGPKHVLACLQDDAGHRSPIGDDIDLDTTAPAPAGLAIRGRIGFACCFQGEFCSATMANGFLGCSESASKSRLPVAALEFGFASSTIHTGSEVAIANGELECSALSGWKPFAPTGNCQDPLLGGAGYECQRFDEWALSEAEGEVTVTVCVRDPAGLTTPLTDTIEVDRTAPSEASITSASAVDRVVSLSWEGSASSDLVGYRVKWFQAGYPDPAAPMPWVQQVQPPIADPNHLAPEIESLDLTPPAEPFSNCEPVELRVMAFDDAGNWSFSAPSTVTPAYPAPTAVRVVGNARELQVSWDPVPDAAAYRIYVASSADVVTTAQGSLQVPAAPTSIILRDGDLLTYPSTTETHVDLADGVTYHVAVAALDGTSFVGDCYSDLSASDEDATRTLLVSDVKTGTIHEGRFGAQVAAADFDHDGYSDLIISSPATPDVYIAGNNLVQAPNAGIVEIYSGRTGSRVFLANGARPGELAGVGLAVLGDLDRDGWNEFAVGRPGWAFNDASATNSKRGRVDLYSGRTGFLMKSLYAPTPTDGDEFGYAIASAGDFNGDNVEEVAISAPGCSSGAGCIFFFDGATQGELSTRRRTGQPGERYGERLFRAVHRARSVNGNILAASTPARSGFNGVARVFRPAISSDLLEVVGTAARPVGAALALSEPFGSTEFNLFAVGMPGATAGPRVARYSCDGSTATAIADIVSHYAATIAFGSSLAWTKILQLGDTPDLVVAGSDQGNQSVQGRIAIFQHDAAFAPRLALELKSGVPGSRFGTSLAVGRFDNSGVDQIAVGAPELFIGNFKAGGVFILGHSLLQLSPAVSASVRLGQIAFASSGGTPERSLDFAPGGNDSGGLEFNSSAVYQAGLDSPAEDTLRLTDAKNRQLEVTIPVVRPAGALGAADVSSVCAADVDCGIGAALTIIHDVDNDGHRDLAVGAPLYPPWPASPSQTGALLIVSGTGGFPNNTLLARVDNPVVESFPAEFGTSVAALDDLDGDGIGEIAVGAPRADYGGHDDSGRVDIFSGATIRTTKTVLYSFGGSEDNQQLGRTLAYLGSYDDQDGPNLAVGNPWYSAGSGLVCVANLLASGITPWRSFGAPAEFCTPQNPGDPMDSPWNRLVGNSGDLMGQAIAGGDVSGDGIPDLIVGAPLSDNGSRTNAGRVLVLLGSRYRNIMGQVALDLFGTSTSAWLGWALKVGSDLDGDGSRELLVGAPADSSRGFTRGGAIYLVSTRTGGVLTSHHGTENYAYFGSAVAVADFNRDGHADWIVGAPGEPTDLYGDDGDIYLIDGSSSSGQNVYPGLDGKLQMWGYCLAAGADIDGDGFEDFVAGTPGRGASGPGGFSQPGGAKLFFTCSPNNRGGVCPP